MVRRVQAGNTWHPADDQLQGTSAYGTFVNDPTADSTFSVPYDIENVVEFLFATGDGVVKGLVVTRSLRMLVMLLGEISSSVLPSTLLFIPPASPSPSKVGCISGPVSSYSSELNSDSVRLLENSSLFGNC